MSEANNNEGKVYRAYEKYADRIWENGYRFNPVYIASKALSDWVLLTSIDLKDKKVLNIGCAEPIDEIQFIEKVSKWVALDINEKLVKAAEEIARRKLHPSLFSKLEFVQGDGTALDFEDSTFDVVVSFSTIEHIPYKEARQKVLEEIARVVKRGGYVVVTVPNRWNVPYRRWSDKAMAEGKTDFGYEYKYSPLELKRGIIEAGLKPRMFVSNLKLLHNFVPFIPIDSLFYLLIRYFGDRIGWLAIRE
jgi:SAM-dependent methyltransferase